MQIQYISSPSTCTNVYSSIDTKMLKKSSQQEEPLKLPVITCAPKVLGKNPYFFHHELKYSTVTNPVCRSAKSISVKAEAESPKQEYKDLTKAASKGDTKTLHLKLLERVQRDINEKARRIPILETQEDLSPLPKRPWIAEIIVKGKSERENSLAEMRSWRRKIHSYKQ